MGVSQPAQTVEAKAHVAELSSPGTQARGVSREDIEGSLGKVVASLDATPLVPWTEGFYQLANRLAQLWFVRQQSVDARLVLVDVLGDADMGGPATGEPSAGVRSQTLP